MENKKREYKILTCKDCHYYTERCNCPYCEHPRRLEYLNEWNKGLCKYFSDKVETLKL